MQRHILGLTPLTTPYKLIAADIDNNERISAVDIVMLRRLILGHIDELPDNDSWRFISANYTFDDVTAPWPIPASADLGSLEASAAEAIMAIKVGDLNANAVANSGLAAPRSDKSFGVVKSVDISRGQLTLRLSAQSDINTYGFQIGLDYDQAALRLVDIKSNGIYIVDDMIRDEDGTIQVSAMSARPLRYEASDAVVELTFNIISLEGNADEFIKIGTNNRSFESEIYNERFEALSLQIKKEDILGSQLQLLQNRPNPFDQETLIEFSLSKDAPVTFEVYDVNGQRIHFQKQDYRSGLHQLRIDKETLGLNKGIYYYQIHSNNRSLVRKMVVL